MITKQVIPVASVTKYGTSYVTAIDYKMDDPLWLKVYFTKIVTPHTKTFKTIK